MNSDIVEINDTVIKHSAYVFVRYANGDFVMFNYLKGEIYQKNYDEPPSVTSYIRSFVVGDVVVKTASNKSYEEANQVIEKLNDKSLSEVWEIGEKDNSSYYGTVYNPATKNYDIYEFPLKDNQRKSLSEALQRTSVSDQIRNNSVLAAYYEDSSNVVF